MICRLDTWTFSPLICCCHTLVHSAAWQPNPASRSSGSNMAIAALRESPVLHDGSILPMENQETLCRVAQGEVTGECPLSQQQLGQFLDRHCEFACAVVNVHSYFAALLLVWHLGQATTHL